MHSYRIERTSKRVRSITLKVQSGQVIVRAPAHTSLNTIETLVRKKHAWIARRIETQQSMAFDSTRLHGAQFSVLGASKILHLCKDPWKTKQKLCFYEETEGTVRVCYGRTKSGQKADTHTEAFCKNLSAYLIQEGTAPLHDRLDELLESINQSLPRPHKTTLKTVKSFWGMLRTQRVFLKKTHTMHINAMLLLEPWPIVRAVLIHELCHQKHHGHTKDFWRLVAKFVDDYASVRHHLRAHVSPLNTLHWMRG